MADLAAEIYQRIGPQLPSLPSQEEDEYDKGNGGALLGHLLEGERACFSPGTAIMLIGVLCLVAEMHGKTDSNEEMEKKEEQKRPEYLHCLEAGRSLTYMTADCLAASEYGACDYYLALRLLSLLLATGYCRHRGRWYLRMCIDLEHLESAR